MALNYPKPAAANLLKLLYLECTQEFADISVKRILHLLLAVFEILLGFQLLLLPMVDHLYVRQTITVWALLGGVLFVGTAVYEHRQYRQDKQAAQNPDSSTEHDGAQAAPQESK